MIGSTRSLVKRATLSCTARSSSLSRERMSNRSVGSRAMAGAYAVLGSRTLYRGGLPDALATKAQDSGLGTRSLRDPARFAFTAFSTLTALGRDSVAHRVSSTEARRVGNECVSTCRYPWSPSHTNTTHH